MDYGCSRIASPFTLPLWISGSSSKLEMGLRDWYLIHSAGVRPNRPIYGRVVCNLFLCSVLFYWLCLPWKNVFSTWRESTCQTNWITEPNRVIDWNNWLSVGKKRSHVGRGMHCPSESGVAPPVVPHACIRSTSSWETFIELDNNDTPRQLFLALQSD